jgi:hypothetical protein
VMASRVLAVRRVARFGDTLATSRRWASPVTWAEGTCTVSARRAGWTAWIAPPVRSTAVRNSVIAGSVELLTMITWTWRTPFRSRIQLALALPVSTRPDARSRAIFAGAGSICGWACALSNCARPTSRASETTSHDRTDRGRRPASGTMSVEIVFMVCRGKIQRHRTGKVRRREHECNFPYIEKHGHWCECIRPAGRWMKQCR